MQSDPGIASFATALFDDAEHIRLLGEPVNQDVELSDTEVATVDALTARARRRADGLLGVAP